MINYDTGRGISVTKDGSGSTLSLANAQASDSGNYTCSPYNIRAASVLVHVLSEGNSAAAVQNEQDDASKMASMSSSKASAGNSAIGSTNVNNNNQAPPSAAVHSSSSAATLAKVVLIVGLLWLRIDSS